MDLIKKSRLLPLIKSKGAISLERLKRKAPKVDDDKNTTDIPLELMNAKYEDTEDFFYKGREKETQMVFDILQKGIQCNVLLVGPFGIGKNSIVETIAEKIAKGSCPEIFKDTRIVKIQLESLNPSIVTESTISDRIVSLKDYMSRNPGDILYIKNVETLIGYGLLNLFKPIFSRFRAILTIDEAYYDANLWENDHFMITNFEVIDITAPQDGEAYDILQNPIKCLSQYHGVEISEEHIKLIMELAYKESWKYIPWEIMNHIDYAMGVCKNRGLDKVDIRAILEKNRNQIERFFSMPDEKLKLIAYHEAGHCIVGKSFGLKFDGIQIIPSEKGLGYNTFSFGITGSITRSQYLDYISMLLAGVLSTDRKSFETIDGICGDIQKATNIARSMLLAYGMCERRVSYFEEDELNLAYMTDAMKEKLNTEVAKILDEAKNEAEIILAENEEKIEILVQALLKKGFLTTAEVEALLETDENGKKLTVDDLPNIHDLIF